MVFHGLEGNLAGHTFSRDGRRFGFGRKEGAVTVCELNEVYGQLARSGFAQPSP
jgi:hypothetical protein